MSFPGKPAIGILSWHNQRGNLWKKLVSRELSTFSTGFSTASSEKTVDKSGIKHACRKNSTVLQNSVEGSLIYITTFVCRGEALPRPESSLQKNGRDNAPPLRYPCQSNKIFAAKIRSFLPPCSRWASTMRQPPSGKSQASSSFWVSRASLI